MLPLPLRARTVTAPVLFALAAVAVALAYPLLTDSGQVLAYQAVGAAAAVAVAIGVRRYHPRERFTWVAIAGGLAVFSAGDAFSGWYPLVRGTDAPFPSAADVLYLIGYPLFAAALFALFKARRRARLGDVLDVATLAVASGAVIWELIIEPTLEEPVGFAATAVAVAYPVMDTVLLAALLYLLVGGVRSTALRIFAGGAALLLVADLLYASQLVDQTYQFGGLLDTGWLLSYGLMGAAGLHASVHRARADRPDRRVAPASLQRLAALGFAAVALPWLVVLYAQPHDERAFDLVAANTVVVVLVLVRMAVLVRDRLRAEQASQANRELYRRVVDTSTDLIALVDDGCRATFVSPAFQETLGHEPEALVGTHLLDLVHPDDREAATAIVRGSAATEAVRLRLRRADGGYIQTEVTSTHVRARSGEPRQVLVTARDVSDRERLEKLAADLSEADKMEALGRLSSGIAHDFNNMLLAIHGYAELARTRATDPQLRADLDEIVQVADRGAGLTRQLLAFSRRDAVQTEVVDVDAAVHETVALLSRIVGEDIELVTVEAPGGAHVFADRGQLVRVLTNLGVNARDAMPDGGRITVAVSTEAGAEPGQKEVVITFADTGEGMDAETVAHAFEPFFTTKAPGKGTGLGLSTVHGIVAQFGGRIELHSRRGEGTTFTIRLPAGEAGRPGGQENGSRRPVRRTRAKPIASTLWP
jgi:PAS domain S-box-containing protein